MAGPESTYLCTAAVPILTLLFGSVCLQETNSNAKRNTSEIQDAKGSDRPPGSKSYLALLLDPECCLLAGSLGLYEFMNYPPMNSVSILFMKERLKWGPLEAGRFASGHALAVFTGSMLSGRLFALFGKHYVSMTNLLTSLAFLMWAKASNGWSLVASLLPLSLGTGVLKSVAEANNWTRSAVVVWCGDSCRLEVLTSFKRIQQPFNRTIGDER